MKITLSIIASCFAFSLLSSCGDGDDTSASNDATPPPEMKRIVSVLQSDG